MGGPVSARDERPRSWKEEERKETNEAKPRSFQGDSRVFRDVEYKKLIVHREGEGEGPIAGMSTQNKGQRKKV